LLNDLQGSWLKLDFMRKYLVRSRRFRHQTNVWQRKEILLPHQNYQIRISDKCRELF
jgi:hypothetical protein